ncbi:hypothetical protein A8L34_27805 [Bacillus sp. FJAT-27264]|uniref:hypothetical protein n=1 Tax=Paenibacillus sp. (strain DSM 101736 / FJAT-27264) TaxID=1850362 RepID=UPI000807B5B2|nr:hypothetical protein [Bacillus sp. FJAT-27264]OBZ15855.1 hypothetical protein A8L34_27805 [Bacillus sp. FJAT-27264]
MIPDDRNKPTIDYDYDGLDINYEYDDPDDNPVCSGCTKDFIDPENEIFYIVPRLSPDGVVRLGVRYYCEKCTPAAKERRPDGWDASRLNK